MSAAARFREPEAPAGSTRLLAGVRNTAAPTLAEHLECYGALPLRDDVADLCESAGLRGRGGAAFPLATKLRSVATRRGRRVVVANGVEGEPASGKDKVLLRLAPHLVLDGVVAAAEAVGAREGVIAVSASAKPEFDALGRALRERGREQVAIRVATVPAGFVSGEETALLEALAGRPPKPTVKPPYPFERGLCGAPTLVQNVETLAHLALVARFGADWFRSAGLPGTPGTALVTVGGAVERPGVCEIELGSSLGDLIRRARGASEPLSGILVGGYFGRWVSADDVELRLTPQVLGAGAVIALPRDACPLRECARVIRYLADESAGQCGPCVNGLASIASTFELLADGRVAQDTARTRLERWTSQVAGRGACRHPDGVAGFVESALAVFAVDVDRHSTGAHCRRPSRGMLPLPGARR